ncbi:MAG: glycine--tRNA ligase subunit beta [Nitrospirota bacterium]|nr:glycine--tRNA ligase subunit beta [Nitrospirota bacterium]
MLGDTLPLLFEIGVEEIPSNVLPNALKQLPQIAEKCFTAARLSFSGLEVYGTPRRLILYCPELSVSQETKEEIIIGPPKRAAFDAAGNATKAAEGFAKSQNTPLSEIKIENAAALGAAAKGKKGEYLVLRKTKTGENTATLLEKMLPKIIASLSFPRSMRWNETGVAFIRPIRSILALYGSKVVPFSFAEVASADQTRGHRIMSPDFFSVTDFEHYRDELSRRFVMIDPEERVRVIQSQMEVLGKEKQAVLDFSDKALLEKSAFTVEYPKAICGNFEDDFLSIPKVIIITAMAEHQGYFPLRRKDGELLPHFITILNIAPEDCALIQKGNERVLSARLCDARFYFDQDRLHPLSARLEDLKKVMFQEKLGSVYKKVKRVERLSAFIADAIECTDEEKRNLERAAGLCKNDLVTGVVREFTSLQGTMGRIYATLDGEDAQIGRAIEEHYLPKQAGGALPKTKLGRILSVADKLDTLVGCFVAVFEPTGSEDPYAIRRQALGMIRILISAAELRSLSLNELIQEAITQYKNQGVEYKKADVLKSVSGFLKIRMDTYLSQEIPPDLRAAVLHRNVMIDKPADLVARAEALLKFSSDPLFAPLMMVFKRAIRILPADFSDKDKVDEAVFIHPSEKDLYARYVDIHMAIQSLSAKQSYSEVLAQLATLNDPLNQFFDDVMVMDKDEKVQQNRLSLLYAVSEPFKTFGDFSKIVEVDGGE